MGRLAHPIGPNAIHLCIDMQHLFAAEGLWPAPWLDRILPVVTHLVELCPKRTVFTRFLPAQNSSSAPGRWAAYYQKWHSVTLDHLDPSYLQLVHPLPNYAPPALLFDRPTYSAFANGLLHGSLRARNVDTLVVSGAETDVCVLSTVLSAVDLGYRTILVEDALASSSDRCHDAVLDVYRSRFDIQIEVAEAEVIREYWTTV